MKKKLFITSLALLSTILTYSNPPIDEGKLIFSTRCAGCHNVNKVVTGPALAGVEQRRTQEWIIHFVHSSQTVIKSGDKDAVALYEKFNKVPMPDHPDLSTDNIKNLLAYIKSETNMTTGPALFRPEKWHPAYTTMSIQNNYGFFISYFALVILLVAVLLALVQTKEIQRESKNKV